MNTTSTPPVPLSFLDLVAVREGGTVADALAISLRTARHAEALGWAAVVPSLVDRREWVPWRKPGQRWGLWRIVLHVWIRQQPDRLPCLRLMLAA